MYESGSICRSKAAFAGALRRGALAAFLTVICLMSAGASARAATDPGSSSAAVAEGGSSSTAASAPVSGANVPAYAASGAITGPTSVFHDSVALRYNYAFGKESPFLPSNATSSNGQFLSPKSFTSAQYCGHCHQEAYRQWRQSVHSNSFRAPWYLKNGNLLIDEKGVQYSRHCEGCHNPVALLSGDLSQGMPKKRPFEDEGLTCSTCHSIQSTDTTGTGSYVMGTPAVLVDEAGMAGTFALDQLARIAAQHGAVVRLLGDDRQLSAVESGGALRLIAHEAGAVELTALYRFSDPAEAAATLKLRTGDASGLDYYLARGRVRSGSREAMTEAAYAGWRADMLAGKTTLMTAASGTDVTALSAQARAEREKQRAPRGRRRTIAVRAESPKTKTWWPF